MFDDSKKLVEKRVLAAEALKVKKDAVQAAQAEVDKYTYELQQTTAYAPSDGYVVNLQLRPGQFARLKAPVMSFVSSEDAYLVMAIRQEGLQYVEPGQEIGYFALVARLDEKKLGKDMVFGASGIAAINTGEGADVFCVTV